MKYVETFFEAVVTVGERWDEILSEFDVLSASKSEPFHQKHYY